MNELTGSQRTIFFISISLATFMIVLDYSIANISIPYIAGDLAVSNDEGTYVITSFAVGNAIGLAMTGWLAKRIGDVRLVVASILLFTFFSWTCGLSISLNMLVVLRFIQGFVAGPVMPLAQSLIIKNGVQASRVSDLAIWASIVVTAPVLGPILGGYISYWYSWPWIFYINIPVGIFAASALWIVLKRTGTKQEKIPGDLWGIFFLVIFVTCLQIFLDKGEEWDWLNSNRIQMLISGTIIGFTYLLIREFWTQHPVLHLRLFKIPSFTLSIFCLMVSYGIYFGSVVILPLWLQEYMGYDAIWAGIAVSALGIAPFCLTSITPWVIHKLGTSTTLMLSFIIFGTSCFYAAYFTTAVDVQHIAFSRFLFGFGFTFYISPLIAMSVEDVPPHEVPNAAGMFHFIRAMVGAIGTSVFTTLFERRTIFHHERIGSALTPSNPLIREDNNLADLASLNIFLDVQASLLSINDAFFIMGWGFVCLIFLLGGWILWCRYKGRSASPFVFHMPID